MLICERNVCGIEHAHMFRKDDFLEKDKLNIIIIIMVYFEHPKLEFIKNTLWF